MNLFFKISRKIKSITNKKSGKVAMKDVEDEFLELFEQCKPFTMTSPERMYAMYKATEYVLHNNIPGDIVECGVWKGGSMMISAIKARRGENTSKKLFLYDTYEGMEKPTDKDVSHSGKKAENKWNIFREKGEQWCGASLEDVRKNILSTDYPENQLIFIKGKVQDTIPKEIPQSISILRLDTDWYESTYHELLHLFPLLSQGGVLILDDYGHWRGAREAVDKYFKENNIPILLNRVDYTGRIGIRQ